MSSKVQQSKTKRKSGIFLGSARVPQLIGPADGDKGATYYEIHHKNVMVRYGKENVNPMNDLLKDDKTILELKTESTWELLSSRWYQSFCWNACACPVCGWALCTCISCFQKNAIQRHQEFSDAHILKLREKSLLWEVRPYHYRCINYENDLSGSDSGISPDPFGYCTDSFMATALQTEPIYETIPLEDVHSVELLSTDLINQGNPICPPTLIVRLKCNPGKPAFAIDMPENGQEFIKAVMAQIEKIKDSPMKVPDEWCDYRDAYFDSEVEE